jgi:hypothetical protein
MLLAWPLSQCASAIVGTMSVVLAETYRAKAAESLREAEKAHSAAEKDHWLKLADFWAALALEVNPSGALPWDVQGG